MHGSGGRLERDLLGTREVPENSYWGIHTLRAIENFPITGVTVGDYSELVVALACVKEAAACANRDLGLLDAERAEAIQAACRAVRAGRHNAEFAVDIVQGGAGTSTNMNANEVIANLALEHMGHDKGDYARLSPNEHVNMSQSTNDVYPTALKVAIIMASVALDEALEHLRSAFAAKATEFASIVKVGRTQLQDAVPMTLGQEFMTYAVMIEEDRERLKEIRTHLHEINLGATAIGTGLNVPPGYKETARAYLQGLTDLPLRTAPNLIEATQDCGAFVLYSGMLRRVAVKLSKICNDLRLLASGPRAGLAEIQLPARQAGSSIMPGKVNPVVPEMVNQVAFEVVGNDVTVTMAAEAGQLQLNAFEPIIAWSILKSLARLTVASCRLAEDCIGGITANEDALREQVAMNIGLATALNPLIGYTAATEVAARALATGQGIPEVVTEMELLTADQLRDLFGVVRLVNASGGEVGEPAARMGET